MTQCDKIIEYMKTHEGITSADAFYKLGVGRLASRIHDLRADGYVIDSVKEHNSGYYGWHTRYHLVKDPNEVKADVKLEELPEEKTSFVDFMKGAFKKWKGNSNG